MSHVELLPELLDVLLVDDVLDVLLVELVLEVLLDAPAAAQRPSATCVHTVISLCDESSAAA